MRDERERERKLDNTGRRDSKKTISISVCKDTRRSKTRRTQETGHHTFYRNFEYVVLVKVVDSKREFKSLYLVISVRSTTCAARLLRGMESFRDGIADEATGIMRMILKLSNDELRRTCNILIILSAAHIGEK